MYLKLTYVKAKNKNKLRIVTRSLAVVEANYLTTSRDGMIQNSLIRERAVKTSSIYNNCQ